PAPSALLLLQLLLPPTSVFFPNIWSLLAAAPGSITHQDLTEDAALNIAALPGAATPCRPLLRLKDFLGRTLLANDLFAAYFGPGSPSRRFRAALGEVSPASAAQDFLPTSRAALTCTVCLRETLVAARALDHSLARQRLGAALHALQDFYSHSSWVGLGKQQPHPHLLWPRPELQELGDPTCSGCEGLSCPGNWLGFTQLTSGYFGTHSSKPPATSHGGHFDRSSSQPTSPGFSPHHMLHLQAAKLALLASIQAFNLLRSRLGDWAFGCWTSPQPPYGRGDRRCSCIVGQRRGSPTEPTHYVLVPFRDPGFNPVFTTSDPDSFWQQLSEIHALGGGGDEPEMCPSALQLALLHTPPFSDIFVFTDASPKDAFLTNQVEPLAQERRCRVTFLVTEDPSRGQARARCKVLSPLHFEPYEAVALASGGEVIFTEDQHIQDVAAIVGESMAAMVTLPLDPPIVVSGRPLVFSVDGLPQKVTVRIHGDISSFWIKNPSGISQGQEEGVGPLGHTHHFGQQEPGRSRSQLRTSLDFLFHFGIPMEDGPHPGLYPLTQAVAGLRTQLLVEVTGLGPRGNSGDPWPHFSYVILPGVLEGAELGRVPLEPMGPPERGLLAASLPPTLLSTPGPFSLELLGQDRAGRSLHRVAPQPCTVVPVLLELSGPPGFLTPGGKVMLSLRIASFWGPQDLDLTTSVSPSFALTSSLSRFRLGQNESAWGRLWLEVPDSAAPDSVVLVTVTAVGQEACAPTFHLRVAPAHPDIFSFPLGPARWPCPLTWPCPHHAPPLPSAGLVGGMAGNSWWSTVGGGLLPLSLAFW
uniref:von Willebrand factor A domain containing 7 n=1 Tax=Microcebus murinus TaxID=30608 RepID=A0A8C5UN01_MICMU